MTYVNTAADYVRLLTVNEQSHVFGVDNTNTWEVKYPTDRLDPCLCETFRSKIVTTNLPQPEYVGGLPVCNLIDQST